MIKRRRPGLTESEQAEIWRNKKSGKSLNEIGRIMGRSTSHIRLYVLASGGVAPRARRRSRLALRRAEREEISRGLAAGDCPQQRDVSFPQGHALSPRGRIKHSRRSMPVPQGPGCVWIYLQTLLRMAWRTSSRSRCFFSSLLAGVIPANPTR